MSDSRPKVSGSPARIWLVYGDIDQDCDHSECGEVAWCEDKIHPSDVLYVRAGRKSQSLAAELDALRARVAELEADRDSWRRVAERLEREKLALRAALEAATKPFPTGSAVEYHRWYTTTRREALDG